MAAVYYRVLRDVSIGNDIVHSGTADTLEKLPASTIEILIERGVIRRLQAPPLRALPGWKTRADRLGKLGVITVDDLNAASSSKIASSMRVTSETVEKWKAEATGYMLEPASAERKRGS